MNPLVLAALVALSSLGAGCKNKSADEAPAAGSGSAVAPATGSADPAGSAAGSAAPAKEDVVATTMLKMYGEVATKICACADKACADAAKAEGDQIETDARESGITPTPAQAAQFEENEATINACANKFP